MLGQQGLGGNGGWQRKGPIGLISSGSMPLTTLVLQSVGGGKMQDWTETKKIVMGVGLPNWTFFSN